MPGRNSDSKSWMQSNSPCRPMSSAVAGSGEKRLPAPLQTKEQLALSNIADFFTERARLSGSRFHLQTAGVMPMATSCNDDHIQFYQCWWTQDYANRQVVSGVGTYAAKFRDTVVRVISISGAWARVCIDSLDGFQSLDHCLGDKRLEANDVMVQCWSSGVRVSRPSTGW